MMKAIKLKVCGMKDPDNIAELTALAPDYMGFIFYPDSKRYLADLSPEAINKLPAGIKTTGVFVNAQLPAIADAIATYSLKAVQLHGAETPELCESIKLQFPQVELIKAFGVDEGFNFDLLHSYDHVVDYFLFDTKTEQHGGSGKSFNWQKLKQYTAEKPYFLSGGIGATDVAAILGLNHPALYAIDINSRFELQPGLKDIALIKKFKENLYSPQG